MNKLIYKITLFSFLFFTTFVKPVSNVVDHKNLQLNLYLDYIKYNTQEKLGILPYILENPNGIYLEIGTGGDPIAELLSHIPDYASPTIIASDIDQNILKLLPVRHPQLNKYIIERKSGPLLKFQQLDATSMDCFADSYFSGINASAVVHEIVSYAGGMQALEKFFAESLRILKPYGVLVYRDPEAINKRHELVEVNLKTPEIRLFTHIFLIKFLDVSYGRLTALGRKYKNYDQENITVTFYKKNEIKPCKLTFSEYMDLRSFEIDFTRKFSICLPKGLCREIERHYLTYLHQCNPTQFFVKCFPTIESNSYFVNYLAHSTNTILQDFLEKNEFSIIDGMIDVGAKRAIDQKISTAMQTLEFGIVLHFKSKQKERQLYFLLKEHNLNPNIYIIQTKYDECLLDYRRIFGLLYDDIMEKIFDHQNGPINKDDIIHAQWLQREGEETYIYYSDDELITKVAEISLNHANNETEGYILAPSNATQNKFIPRLCYDEVIKESVDINDLSGYSVEIKEGKRIIHFNKIPLKKAICTFEEIISTDPHSYENLQKFIASDRVKNILALKENKEKLK